MSAFTLVQAPFQDPKTFYTSRGNIYTSFGSENSNDYLVFAGQNYDEADTSTTYDTALETGDLVELLSSGCTCIKAD